MRVASADTVRRAIAAAMLSRERFVDAELGEIRLRDHQRAAAARLYALIVEHGGAMLAEPVGLGKTYASLAVARRAESPVLIAPPAALRDMWTEALARTRVVASIVTHEALSRGARVDSAPAFVIVDEAHRLRSPGTRRYAALAELCCRARVLLVSATPIQNRRTDVAAQLALFLGRRAWSMGDDDLARFVVRAEEAGVAGLPSLVGPRRLSLSTPDDVLDDLLELPPPVPARDESLPAALLSYGLLHQWASSRAALVAALVRRRARALSLASALDAGRVPTRSELSAWTHTSDAIQLAFPELVTRNSEHSNIDAVALRAALDRHDRAVSALLRRLAESPDPDDERAELLRQVRARHPGERIIAFCQYAETVASLRRRLTREAGIAALTASGARIASGRISRATVLTQFTPLEDSARARAESRTIVDRIDLLITTDLLSEGLNLQEASVVVHLDFPWNPARLDQRVGRVRRLGSRYGTVTAYAITPPAAAERLLRIEQRLRDKLSIAQRAIGVAGRILPSPFGVDVLAHQPARAGLAEVASAVTRRLRVWGAIATDAASDDRVQRVGVAESDIDGFIAVVRSKTEATLVADLGEGIQMSVATLDRALAAADGSDLPVDMTRVRAVLARLDRWLAARRGESAVDLGAASAARMRRATLTRVAQTIGRAPRHRRALLAPLADAARTVATAHLGEGAERILAALAAAELPDEAWLRSVAAFAQLNTRPAPAAAEPAGVARVIALLLLERRDRG